MTGSHRAAYWAAVTLWWLNLSGCASMPSAPPGPCTDLQQEISTLQQQLAAKDAEITRLQAQQQAREREREETTVQAARAEVKLRRFATEADAASRLAEVEVALETLQARPGAGDRPLQALIRPLADMAEDSFKQGEFNAAVERSTQARQLIDMLLANDAASDQGAAPESAFKVAVPLRIKVDTRLRSQPDTRAAVLGVLPATTPVTALGYHGLWLQVQTPDGDTGWISSELVELP